MTYICILRHGSDLVVATDSRVTAHGAKARQTCKIIELGHFGFFTCIGGHTGAEECLEDGTRRTIYEPLALARAAFDDGLSTELVATRWAQRFAEHAAPTSSGDEDLCMGIFGDVRDAVPAIVTARLFGHGGFIDLDRSVVRLEDRNRIYLGDDGLSTTLVSGQHPLSREFREAGAKLANGGLDQVAELGELFVRYVSRLSTGDHIGGDPSVLICDHTTGNRWVKRAAEVA